MGVEPPPSRGVRLIAGARAHPNLSLALIALAAAAAYVGATVLWPGRSARVVAVVDAVAAAMRKGDTAGVMEHVSPQFAADGFNRESLSEALAAVLSNRPLDRITISVRDVDTTSGRLAAKVHVTARLRAYGGSDLNRSEWYVTLEQDGDRWLIVSIRPVYVGGMGQRGSSGLGYILYRPR